MEKLHWKDGYCVGIENIDRQHQHLFAITNKLIERAGASADSGLVSETLTEMLNYAREHFADEEALMEKYGYPEIEPHRNQHASFVRTTAELSINALNNQSTVSREIVEFLKIWLTLHILKVDMRYREFFRQKIPAGIS